MVAVQEHLDLDRAVALQHKKGNGKGKERWRLYLARRKRRGVRRVKHTAVTGELGVEEAGERWRRWKAPVTAAAAAGGGQRGRAWLVLCLGFRVVVSNFYLDLSAFLQS